MDSFTSTSVAELVAARPDPVAAAVLLWAALVLVPWGLRLGDDSGRGELAGRVLRLASWAQIPAALVLAASFAFNQGPLAAALAIPWCAVTLLVASAGGLDLVHHGARLDARGAMIAAMLFLPVGGSWAVISRCGMRPQDFSHAIVLLTAVHFHYAGFLLPVMASLVMRTAEKQTSRLDKIMLAAIIAGVPLVGVGISLSPHVEVAAAWLLTIGCLLLAIRQFQAALASRNSTQLMLLGVSSLSLLSAMGLAAVYATGEFTGEQLLSIPTMIRTHGAANAVGFATCGLAGWAVCNPSRTTAEPSPAGRP